MTKSCHFIFLSQLLQITGTYLKDSFEHGLPGDENGKSCQLEFGSYCLWSVEHEEVMKDFIVKRLKDQLFVARAYYPSIVKLDGMEKLSHEMKQNTKNMGICLVKPYLMLIFLNCKSGITILLSSVSLFIITTFVI